MIFPFDTMLHKQSLFHKNSKQAIRDNARAFKMLCQLRARVNEFANTDMGQDFDYMVRYLTFLLILCFGSGILEWNKKD